MALELKTLIVRRSRRMAGLNLLFASGVFGLAVAVTWQAWQQGESLGASLLFLAIAAFWGVLMGQQFRDDAPKVVVGKDGLDMQGVSDGPVPWDKIEELALGTGVRALGGGRLDIYVDLETYSKLKLGNRWMGDLIVRRAGTRPGFTILGAGLDTKPRVVFEALRRHWPVPKE